jgi:hypothetical protein
MKRTIAILALLILLTGLVTAAPAYAAPSTRVSGSMQQIPWPELPINATNDPAAMFTGTSLYLVSGTFNGWAFSTLNTDSQLDGVLKAEGIFSFVEVFGGEATGSSFLARFFVEGQNSSLTDGDVTASLNIIAGTGDYADLSGIFNLRLQPRYNPYFYRVLWSGVYNGKLKNLLVLNVH